MNPADEYEYNVIQFLDYPYKEMVVCVPRSWVQSRGPDDRIVRVSYPNTTSSATEKRVKNRKKKLYYWNTYLCVVIHRTDSYDEAKLYIQRMTSEDNTLSSAKVERPERRARAKRYIMDALELTPTSNNNYTSTSTAILKRKALPDKEAHNKRWKVTEPNESDFEVAEPSSQALELTTEDQSLTPEVSDEELPVENSNNRNNTENKATFNTNHSEANNSLDSQIIVKQEFIDEFFRCVQELQTNLQVYTSSLFTETVKKFMNNVNMYPAWRYNCPIASSSKNTTQDPPKLNEKKRNAEKDDEDDDDDDDDGDSDSDSDYEDFQHLKKAKRIKKVVLPSEYYENDSRWTLKYRKPAPGLVELMPHTGVYVKANALSLNKRESGKRLSKDCKKLARMLLTEIFTKTALSTCSWTGRRATAHDRDGTNVRPGLNEHARTVLLNYVTVRAEEEDCNNGEPQTILNSMRSKMQEMRRKYE